MRPVPFLLFLIWQNAALTCAVGGETKSTAGSEFTSPYQEIDEYALAAPKEAEQSMPKLIEYFRKQATTDEQMARAIFRWMADRIVYDFDGFLAGKLPDPSPANVFKTRKTICDGYAGLYEQLGKLAGLQVGKLQGHSKGYGFKYGEKLKNNHAWNAVKIGDNWKFVDVTFGAGLPLKDGTRVFEGQYFFTPPDQFIFDHFPENANGQLLKTPIDVETYMKWPIISPNLFQAGVGAQDIHQALADKDFRELVFPYRDVSNVRVVKVPLQRHLSAGQEYTFQVRTPKGAKLAVVNDKVWRHAEGETNMLEMKVRAQKGELTINVKLSEKDESYRTVLKYDVE